MWCWLSTVGIVGLLLCMPFSIAIFHPNDTYWDDDPNTPEDEDNQWGPEMIRVHEAWDPAIDVDRDQGSHLGSNTIIVAIIDSGFWMHNKDLESRYWINKDDLPGENGNLEGEGEWDDDGNDVIDDVNGADFFYDVHPISGNRLKKGFTSDGDMRGCHGTSLAGILGSEIDNELGIAGITNVAIMPLKVFSLLDHWSLGEFGTDNDVYNNHVFDAMIDALDYANEKGADIIVLATGVPPTTKGRMVFDKLYDYYWEENILPIGAAGNDNDEMTWYPGVLDYATIVGMVDQEGNREVVDEDTGSNYGEELDIMGPSGTYQEGGGPEGESIFTVDGRPAIPGGNVPQEFQLDKDDDDFQYELYQWLSGTSVATPHVAGVAALAWSVRPDLTNFQIQRIVELSAKDMVEDEAEIGWDEYTGWGLVDAKNAIDHVTEFQNQYSAEVTIRDFWDNLNPLYVIDYDMDIDEGGNSYVVVSTIDDPVNPSVSHMYYHKISPDGSIVDSRKLTNTGNHYYAEVDVFADSGSLIHLAVLNKNFIGGTDIIAYYELSYDIDGNIHGWDDIENTFGFKHFKQLNIVYSDGKGWVCVLGKDPGGPYDIFIYNCHASGMMYKYNKDSCSIHQLDAETRKEPAPHVVLVYSTAMGGKWVTFDAMNKLYGEPISFLSPTSYQVTDLDLGTNFKTGDSYIVYRLTSSNHEIYVTTLDADGNYLCEQEFVGDFNGGTVVENNPCVSVDRLGRGHVWWQRRDEGGDYRLHYGVVTRLGANYLVDKMRQDSPSGPIYSLTFEQDMTPPGEYMMFPIVRCFESRWTGIDGIDDNEIRVLYYDTETDSLVYRVSKSSWQSQSPIVNGASDETFPDIAYDNDRNIHMVWQKGTGNVQYNSWDLDNNRRSANHLDSELDDEVLGSLYQYHPEICIREYIENTEILAMFCEIQGGHEKIIMVKIRWDAAGNPETGPGDRFVIHSEDNIEAFEAVYDPLNDCVHIVLEIYSSTDEDLKYIVVSADDGSKIRNADKIDGDKTIARNPSIALDPFSYPYIVFDDAYKVYLVHIEFDWGNPNGGNPIKHSQQVFADDAFNPRICSEGDIKVNGDVNIRDETDYDFGTHPNMEPNVNWQDKNDRYVHVVARRFSDDLVGSLSILKYGKIRMDATPEIVLELDIYAPGEDPIPTANGDIIDMVIDSRNRLYIAHWDVEWDAEIMDYHEHIRFQEITNNGLMFVKEYTLEQQPEGQFKHLQHVSMDIIRYVNDDDGISNELSVVWAGNLVNDNDYDIYLRRSNVFDEFVTNENV